MQSPSSLAMKFSTVGCLPTLHVQGRRPRWVLSKPGPGMPGDTFWCQNKVPVPVDDPCPSGPKPLRRETGLAHKFMLQPALSSPKLFARRRLASSSLSSISSRPTVISLTHPASNCLQLTGAKRNETEIVATDKHTKYLRGHLAVVAPSKTIAPRHPIPDRIIIQRQRRQQN